jgi:hypothetical protein
MKKQIFAVAIAAMAITTGAQAAVTVIGTQAAFSAAGTIVQTTNFDSNGGLFTFPGNPYTIGALTFVGGNGNIIGGIADWDMARSLITDSLVLGTTVQISGAYDLFAFNAGNFFRNGTTTIDIVTNLGSYQFTPSTTLYAYNGSLTFLGYQTGPGEYFTSIRFSGNESTGGTDFQIGTAGAVAVPEPASWALMIMGFGLTGAAMRRRAVVTA